MTRTTVVALTLLALACTPTTSSTDTAADQQAIRGALDGWNQALTAANDSLLATYYTEDAEMLPPNVPPVRGRANIRAFWATVWPLQATLTMSPARIETGGDIAIETGTWTWTVHLSGGEQRDHGKYIHTWRRIDGNWLIAANIWNSDLTPTEAASMVKQ